MLAAQRGTHKKFTEAILPFAAMAIVWGGVVEPRCAVWRILFASLASRNEELRETCAHVSALTRVKGHQRASWLYFRCESVKEGNPICGGEIRALEGHLEAEAGNRV